MKTKWEYYIENKYWIATLMSLTILGFAIGHAIKSGWNIASLAVVFLMMVILVVIKFGVDKSYKRYVEQEMKKEWAKQTATAMYSRYQETRTDMINTEEDD